MPAAGVLPPFFRHFDGFSACFGGIFPGFFGDFDG
jgi:hypothetical protein